MTDNNVGDAGLDAKKNVKDVFVAVYRANHILKYNNMPNHVIVRISRTKIDY